MADNETNPLVVKKKSPKKAMTTMDILREELPQLKWRVLILLCCMSFGSYYIYDFPGSIGTAKNSTSTIQGKFRSHGQSYNQAMNLALYTVYSAPNSILALFGGILIDRILGLRRATILFSILVVIGSAVVYIGVLTVSYPVVVLGRLLFGLGGESLTVAQSALCARWFRKGRGMALAFGITVSFSRVGSSVNFAVTPTIAQKVGIDWAVLSGVLACAFSLATCVLIVILDKREEQRGNLDPERKEAELDEDGNPIEQETGLGLKAIFQLPLPVLYISLVCFFYYITIFPFIGVVKEFFQVKYDVSDSTSGVYAAVYQFVCAGGSPITGFLVDFAGRITYWLITSSVGLILIFLGFAFSSIPPPAMMALMGVDYSFMVAALWPAVPYAVEQSQTGLSYGVITALQNFGLSLVPLAVGFILDKHTPKSQWVPINGTTHAPSPSTSTHAPTPSTHAPSTHAPSTHAPSTHAPSTNAPSTHAPSTHAPSTNAPSTHAPSTHAPSTHAPSTNAPSTHAPSTHAPSTNAPSTHAPSTNAPSTHAPSTPAPSTNAPTKPPMREFSTASEHLLEATAAPPGMKYETYPPTLKGYRIVLLMLTGFGVTALFFSVVLFMDDKAKRLGILSASPTARKRLNPGGTDAASTIQEGGNKRVSVKDIEKGFDF